MNIYKTIIHTEPIYKGWSEDKKYSATTADSRRVFLRVSEITEHDHKKAEYDNMKHLYEAGAPVPEPLEFGVCDDGMRVYSLSEWLDGKDAESLLPMVTEIEQYVLGLKSGEALRKIHRVPVTEGVEDWAVRFNRKVKNWVDKYNSLPNIHSDTGEMLIQYLNKHHDVLSSCSVSFIHGDYNADNIMCMPDGTVKAIDFNSYNASYGDPWWDMNNMAWMTTMYPHFYTGQIRGYFNGEPPDEFWNKLLYYLAYDALAALTDPYGLNGIEDGTEIVNNILKWTNNFQNSVPTWYLNDFNIIETFEMQTGLKLKSMQKFNNVPTNTVYRVETNAKTFIFKAYSNRNWPENGKLLFINRKLREYNIPHAEILAFNREDNSFPNGYLIEICLPGTSADRLKLTTDETLEIYKKLGILMSRIHQIELQGFGYIGSGCAEWTTFSEFVHDMLGEWTANLTANEIVTSDEVDYIGFELQKRLEVCDKYPAVLCHGDLSIKNVLVYSDDITIIDWDDAHALCWMADIARLTMWMKMQYGEEYYEIYRKAFLDNYETIHDKNLFNELEDALHVWHGLDHLNYSIGSPQFETMRVILLNSLNRCGMRIPKCL